GSRVLDRVNHRVGKAHVGLDRMDLPEAPHRLEMPREIRSAYRGPDPPAALREMLNRMAAHEPRSAKHGHQTAEREVRGHARQSPAIHTHSRDGQHYTRLPIRVKRCLAQLTLEPLGSN